MSTCVAERTARILDGKAIANAWKAEIAEDVKAVTAEAGRPPGLAVVLVGDRPDSEIYVHRKQEACNKVGIPALATHKAISLQTQAHMYLLEVSADGSSRSPTSSQEITS